MQIKTMIVAVVGVQFLKAYSVQHSSQTSASGGLSEEDKNTVIKIIDAFIRDTKTKKAYT